MGVKSFKETKVFRKAFSLAMEIFEITKSFPKEETYSLSDQIRRSSRSVCGNIGEAYRKKRYVAHFISKVSDSDAENTETGVWLEFACACRYIDPSTHQRLLEENKEIGRLLNHMINHPEDYYTKSFLPNPSIID